MRNALVIALLLLSYSLKAQDQSVIDSLKNLIGNAEHDTTQINALNKLSRNYIYIYPDSSIYYANQALKLSRANDNSKKAARSFINIANSYLVRSENPLAMENYKEALSIYRDLNDKQGMASSYFGIGLTHSNQSNYPQALDFYLKGLEIQKELKNKVGMASAYNHIGSLYWYQSDYPLALDYHFKSLKINEEMGNKVGVSHTYNNIGLIYSDQSNYPQALVYYFKALEIKEELGNEKGMSSTYNNIGIAYLGQFDYRQALYHCFKALKLFEQLQSKRGMATSYTNIGSVYTTLYTKGDSLEKVNGWASKDSGLLLDSAIYYQQKALTIQRESGEEYGMTLSLANIGLNYKYQQDYRKAIEYFKQAELFSDGTGAVKHQSSINQELSECYQELGQFQQSLEHYKLYSALKDSTFNEDKSKDIGKLEAKHEFETAEAERKRVEEEEIKLEQAAKSRRDNLQYSGILIFMVLVFAGVFALGRVSIPIRLAEGLIFFSFLLFFEFSLVLLDPYIEQYSSGAPAIKLLFNAGIAALIFPAHAFFEGKLKGRLVKK